MMKVNIEENSQLKKDFELGQVRKDKIGNIVLVILYDEFLTTYNAVYLSSELNDNLRFDLVYRKGMNSDRIESDFPYTLEAELNINDI